MLVKLQFSTLPEYIQIAPPSPEAVLPTKVQFDTLPESILIAPPYIAVLLVKLQFVTVPVPLNLIAPPNSEAVLPTKVQFDTVPVSLK